MPDVVVTIEIDNEWHRIEVPRAGNEHFYAIEMVRRIVMQLFPEHTSVKTIASILSKASLKYPHLVSSGRVDPTITHLADDNPKRPKRNPHAVVYGS